MITLLDQTLAKLSICALYLRLFGVKRSNRIWVYILAALQILSYLVLVILQPLQCRPINKFWQYWAEGECLSFSVILAAVEPLNSVIDFALVILAIFMIRSLKMKVDAKWKLCFLFGLGSLAGIFGFVKMGLSYDYKPETIVVLGLWAVVQSVAGIICCCAPVFRPMPIVTIAWDGIRSKLSNYSLRSLLTSKSNTVGASGVGSGYVHEAGSSHTQEEDLLRYDRGHNRWVITSDSGDPTTPNRYPMEFIQVKKSVDVV
ncbi:unnamed protein product [Clonostachys rhizophaga]|uniref:Rhodopsin domain-containing protein n=1 Tax=Clonostachys rhizophaga TaxID=160324 RepID=A0A9N9W3C5_9HYPO|nr:unnamed protein product [Clonostachys rhizophaga]